MYLRNCSSSSDLNQDLLSAHVKGTRVDNDLSESIINMCTCACYSSIEFNRLRVERSVQRAVLGSSLIFLRSYGGEDAVKLTVCLSSSRAEKDVRGVRVVCA